MLMSYGFFIKENISTSHQGRAYWQFSGFETGLFYMQGFHCLGCHIIIVIKHGTKCLNIIHVYFKVTLCPFKGLQWMNR